MKSAKMLLGVLLLSVLVLTLGCNRPPAVPKTAEGDVVKSLPVADEEEAQLAQALMDSHDLYRFRLMVIRGYYNKIGDLLKLRWADNELKNLATSYTFTYEGITPAPVPASPSLDSIDELSLAEAVVSSRKAYLAAVDQLAGFYAERGQSFKAEMATNMRKRFDPIRTYMYFLQAEVPPQDLRGTEVIPEAEQLFAEALKLHKDGKIAPAITNYNKERQALLKFLELIHNYPTSTRIGYSAYYIGDIYKEYFDEDYRACLWYERSWQWEPTIAKPARFQAAVVYDIRLHHRGKALEMYKQVIDHETFNSTNVIFARRRIAQLTQESVRP